MTIATTRSKAPPTITIEDAPQVLNSPRLSSTTPGSSTIKGRNRSSSIVKVEEIQESTDDTLDQGAYTNKNSEWVNGKGAWMIHVVLIFGGKLLFDLIPGVTQDVSWTLTNIAYMALTFLMFHYVTGIPFDPDLHSGAYDDLTLWEQIDEGAQYTPAKKWLLCVPIGLFLVSTHFTRYNPWMFAVNFTCLVLVLIPKLPILHRRRIHILPDDDASGYATPGTPRPPSPSARDSATPRPLSFASET